jgi:uncharacterized DUF497 family protein
MDEIVGGLEWDTAKRRKVLLERGLDFADVSRIDPATVHTDIDRRRDYGEVRYISVGSLDGRLVVVCWTPRNGRSRIISVRKANDRESKKHQARAGHR